MTQPMWCLAAALAMLPASPTAAAAEFPKRKSGLWEVKVEGARGDGSVMKMCIDQASDNALRGMGGPAGEQDCSKNELRREGANRYVTESVCKLHGSTMAAQGVFTGDFATAYSFEVKTTYTPPLLGAPAATTKGQARWTGACPASLKPGQMLLPNGAKVDMNLKR